MIHRRFGIPARRVVGLPAMLPKMHRLDEERSRAD